MQEEPDKYIILRTSWVSSKEDKNPVNTILRLATEHREHCGVYHYSGQPFVSWYEFAKKIVEQGVDDGVLSKAPVVKPCGSDEFPVKAKRPRNSRLSQHKIELDFGVLPDGFIMK